MKQIENDILDYCHAGEVELPGLVRRRKVESYILKGITGISDIDGKYDGSSPKPQTNIKFVYTVMTNGKNYENIADGKTSGKVGQEILGIAIKASSGKSKYRVQAVGGGWLPYATGFNLNDYNNGYDGNGKPIDVDRLHMIVLLQNIEFLIKIQIFIHIKSMNKLEVVWMDMQDLLEKPLIDLN